MLKNSRFKYLVKENQFGIDMKKLIRIAYNKIRYVIRGRVFQIDKEISY